MTKTKCPLAFDTLAWIGDAELRCLPPEARGCLIDLMAYAHSGDPYGYCTVSGKAMDDEMVSHLLRIDVERWTKIKASLITAHRISVAEHSGCIYIKRMVRDGVLKDMATDGGKRGGNPVLFVESTDDPKEEKSKPVSALLYWNKLPLHLQTDEMKDAVNEWHEYRARKKILLTRQSMVRQINQIAPLSAEQAVHWIHTAIDRNWRGLYPPPNGDTRQPNQTARTGQPQTDHRAERARKEYPPNAIPTIS